MVEDGGQKQQDALVSAQAFLQQREGIRDALLAERLTVQQRLSEIDAALSSLGVAIESVNGAPVAKTTGANGSGHPIKFLATFDPPSLKRASMPTIIKTLLAANPDGVTAGEIIASAQSVRRETTPAMVHATLYRLSKKTDEIRGRGDRGERKYALTERGARDFP
jgi:hypothetical protein